MTYHLISYSQCNFKINSDIFKINYTNNINQCTCIVSQTTRSYLNNMKTEINANINDWSLYKKYCNPHEFIHSSVPGTKNSVCSINPVSRSFFKFIEIAKSLLILKPYDNSQLRTIHIAEAPGGFIEALHYLRQSNTHSSNDINVGFSITNSKDDAIPAWHPNILNTPSVQIDNGVGDGDLLNPGNLSHCFAAYSNSMDIITADGGFDFSEDFNNQEFLSSKLIYAEFCYAIIMQKHHGTFILKMFDLFSKVSVQILFLLTCFYEHVYIFKPNTSRSANSEKYIVCLNFKYSNTAFLYNNIYKSISKTINSKYIYSITDCEIPYMFINKHENINALFSQNQIDTIKSVLQLINNPHKNERIVVLKKNNIIKCIKWCVHYTIPYNESFNLYLNIRESIV